MTKDKYYEMCEALGSTPVDTEIPVELEDLPFLVQQAILIYTTYLPDTYEYMGGNYTGKDLSNVEYVFSLFDLDKREQLEMYKLVLLIDKIRKKLEQKTVK